MRALLFIAIFLLSASAFAGQPRAADRNQADAGLTLPAMLHLPYQDPSACSSLLDPMGEAFSPVPMKMSVADIKKKAQQGEVKEQFELCMQRDGDGNHLPFQDDVETAKWCQKAAERGVLRAQEITAIFYRDGRGVKRNYAEAAKWFRKMTEKDDPMLPVAGMGATCDLAHMYAEGHGVPQRYVEAYFWATLPKNHYFHVKELDALSSHIAKYAASYLTPEQKATVDERVQEWKPSPAPVSK